MIVLGTHPEGFDKRFRASMLRLTEKAGRQIGEIAPVEDTSSAWSLQLLDDHRLAIFLDEKKVEITLFEGAKEAIRIVDETIAADAEDLAEMTIDEVWLEALLDRMIALSADYRDVDPASAPTAQLSALSDDVREQIVAIYQLASSYLRLNGHEGHIDLHLTMPTDYWTAGFVAVTSQGEQIRIEDDQAFSTMLEALPSACEIIEREGEGATFEIVPLYLKPVRIGASA